MNQRNYQKELEKIIMKLPEYGAEKAEKPGDWSAGAACIGQAPAQSSAQAPAQRPAPPNLLLHSCCAPCSSYCLEYLCRYFAVTVFFYNPNISFSEEYQKRAEEQKRLIGRYNAENKGYPISIIEGAYEPSLFYGIAKGYENCPEGGERCFRCFDQRLRKTAREAVAGGFDYFTTTLTISPLKNAAKLNEIGEALAAEYGVTWLPSDFKKKNGYKRSVELSAEYDLYRQDYCGCVYSKSHTKA